LAAKIANTSSPYGDARASLNDTDISLPVALYLWQLGLKLTQTCTEFPWFCGLFPSQGIVLYFSLDVTTKAKVQSPGLGILALHFLRTDRRSVLDSLDAYQQNLFAHALSNRTDNLTMFNDNFDFRRSYFNQFGRFIPFEFINQVTPILFKVTGKEILDVSLAGVYSSQAAAQANLIQNQSNAINGIVPLTNSFQPIGPSPNVTNTNVVTGSGNSTSNATATTSLSSDSVITSMSRGRHCD
jgi:hypothetical protein